MAQVYQVKFPDMPLFSPTKSKEAAITAMAAAARQYIEQNIELVEVDEEGKPAEAAPAGVDEAVIDDDDDRQRPQERRIPVYRA